MAEIESKEVSFVVQGISSKKYMKNCLNSIRKYFPEAEIILSTWKNSDISELCFDKLVQSEDPGTQFMDLEKKIPYNINRMLVSTKAGIAKAERKYVVKCRSDLEFYGNELLRYFDKYPNADEQYRITKKKIVVGSIFSLKYEQENSEIYPTPFHVSDFFAFGLKEDIELLYSVPLVEINEFSRYFEYNKRPHEYPIKGYQCRLWRYPPEQYITYHMAKMVMPETMFENCLEYDKVDPTENEKFIVSNFIILDYQQSKVKSQKFPFCIWSGLMLCPERIYKGMYRNYIYQKDYKKYMDGNYELGDDTINKRRRYYVWYHIGKECLKPFIKPVYRWLSGSN